MQEANQTELRVKKVIMRKGNKLQKGYGKAMIIHLIFESIKKTLYK